MSLHEVREALESQDIRRVKRLIDQGFDLNLFYGTFWRRTLLIEYCSSLIGNYFHKRRAVLTLLSFRKHLDLNIADFRGTEDRYTALDYAALWDDIDLVHLLLQAGAHTHQAVHTASDFRLQQMLLAAGAEPSKGLDLAAETKEAARKWLQSLECVQAELLKIFDENQMLVEEVKDFIYTESFLKAAIHA